LERCRANKFTQETNTTLVGTTGQSVYAWESGKAKPRPEALAAIAALRGIGKLEAEAKLAAAKEG
jgi:DNA-binding transcriptional regulator YiaG